MSVSEELEKLQALRDRGSLSEEEFARAKARVLGEMGTAHPAATATSTFLHRLARSRTDRYIGGVCGGLGEHTGLPTWCWRIIFCLSFLWVGAGALIYLMLWIFLPEDPPASP